MSEGILCRRLGEKCGVCDVFVDVGCLFYTVVFPFSACFVAIILSLFLCGWYGRGNKGAIRKVMCVKVGNITGRQCVVLCGKVEEVKGRNELKGGQGF